MPVTTNYDVCECCTPNGPCYPANNVPANLFATFGGGLSPLGVIPLNVDPAGTGWASVSTPGFLGLRIPGLMCGAPEGAPPQYAIVELFCDSTNGLWNIEVNLGFGFAGSAFAEYSGQAPIVPADPFVLEMTLINPVSSTCSPTGTVVITP